MHSLLLLLLLLQEYECLVQVEPEALGTQLAAAAAGLTGAASPAPAPFLSGAGPNMASAAGALASGSSGSAAAGSGAAAATGATALALALRSRPHGGSRCGASAAVDAAAAALAAAPVSWAGEAAPGADGDGRGEAERYPELDTIDAALLEALLGTPAPAPATGARAGGRNAADAAATGTGMSAADQHDHPHQQPYRRHQQGQGQPISASGRRAFTHDVRRPRNDPLSDESGAFASAAGAEHSEASAILDSSPFIAVPTPAQTPRPHAPTAGEVVTAACAPAAPTAAAHDGGGGGAGAHAALLGNFAAPQTSAADDASTATAAAAAAAAAAEAAAVEQWTVCARGGGGGGGEGFGWRRSRTSLPATPRAHPAVAAQLVGSGVSLHTAQAAIAEAGLLPWRSQYTPSAGVGPLEAHPIAASAAVTTALRPPTTTPNPTQPSQSLPASQSTRGLITMSPYTTGPAGMSPADLSGPFAMPPPPLVSPAASRPLPPLGIASTVSGSGGGGASYHSGLLACLTPLHRGGSRPQTLVMSQLVQAGAAAAAQRRHSIGGAALRRSLSASGRLDAEGAAAMAAAVAAGAQAAGGIGMSGAGMRAGAQVGTTAVALCAGAQRLSFNPPRHQSAMGYSASQGPAATGTAAAVKRAILYGGGTGAAGTAAAAAAAITAARSAAGFSDLWPAAAGPSSDGSLSSAPMSSQPPALLNAVGSFGRSRLGPGPAGSGRSFLGSHPGTFMPAAGRSTSSGGVTPAYAAAAAAAAAASYSVDQAGTVGPALSPLFTITDEAVVEYGSDDVRLDGGSTRAATLDGNLHGTGNAGSHAPSAVSASTRRSVGSFALLSEHRGAGGGSGTAGSCAVLSPPAVGRRARGGGGGGRGRAALLHSSAEEMEGLVLVGGVEGDEGDDDEDADADGTRRANSRNAQRPQQAQQGAAAAAAGSCGRHGSNTGSGALRDGANGSGGSSEPAEATLAGSAGEFEEPVTPRSAYDASAGAMESASVPITPIPHSGLRPRAGPSEAPQQLTAAAAASAWPPGDAAEASGAVQAEDAAGDGCVRPNLLFPWTLPPQPSDTATSANAAVASPAAAVPKPVNTVAAAAAAAALRGNSGEASLGVSPAAPPALALDTLLSEDSLGALGRFATGVLSPRELPSLQHTPAEALEPPQQQPGASPSMPAPAAAAVARMGRATSDGQQVLQQVPSGGVPRTSRTSTAASIMRGRPSLQLSSSYHQHGSPSIALQTRSTLPPCQQPDPQQALDQQQQQQQQLVQLQSTPLHKLGGIAGSAGSGIGRVRGAGLKRNTTRDRVQMLFTNIRHQEQQLLQGAPGHGPAHVLSPLGISAAFSSVVADATVGTADGRSSAAQQPWSPGRGSHAATSMGIIAGEGRVTSFRHSCGGMMGYLQAGGLPQQLAVGAGGVGGGCRSMTRSGAGVEGAVAEAAAAQAALGAAPAAEFSVPGAAELMLAAGGGAGGAMDVSGALPTVHSITSNGSGRKWHTAGTAASLASPEGPVANVASVASVAHAPFAAPPAAGTARPSFSKHAAAPAAAAPAAPRRQRWHRMHAVLCDTGQHERLHRTAPGQQQAPGDEAAQAVEQQAEKAAGAGTVMFVTITQIDVTEQVEAQAQLAKLLEQEHKVRAACRVLCVAAGLSAMQQDGPHITLPRPPDTRYAAHQHSYV